MNKSEIKTFINDNSAIYPGDAEFLYEEISKLPDIGNLLEIGTGYGHSTVFFSNLKPNWNIFTIDGYGEFGSVRQFFSFGKFDEKGFNQTRAYIESKGKGNVKMIVGNSKTHPWELPVDVVFIDADHTMEGLKGDFEKYSEFSDLIFLHDWDLQGMEGNEVMEFLETIKDGWNIKGVCHTVKLTRK